MSTICSWYNSSTKEKKKSQLQSQTEFIPLFKGKMNCTNPYIKKSHKLLSILYVTKWLLFRHSFQILVMILFQKSQTQSKEYQFSMAAITNYHLSDLKQNILSQSSTEVQHRSPWAKIKVLTWFAFLSGFFRGASRSHLQSFPTLLHLQSQQCCISLTIILQ